ncbi:hypothetical protein RVV18_002718 [Burkholderia ambifaria]|nr:hypothetical protein [Burkholderia ambifaria]
MELGLLLATGAAFMATGDDRHSNVRDYLTAGGFALTACEWCGVLSQYQALDIQVLKDVLGKK